VLRGTGRAALIATHNPELARRMDRMETLEGGRLVHVRERAATYPSSSTERMLPAGFLSPAMVGLDAGIGIGFNPAPRWIGSAAARNDILVR
jgi:hypothetical protein